MSSLLYISLDVIANKVAMLGRGSLLAKTDIKKLHRMAPVHPDDISCKL